MSENESCLAITEKRTQRQRHGGCVGIFFQLFDWNRRFANKKLFSNKLIAPPAGTKQAAKKFGDDKMPKTKLHMTVDESVEGFSNTKKNGICGSEFKRRQQMKAPSLIARLMGLESMPASSREKSMKVLAPESVEYGEKRSVIGFHNAGCEKALCLEKGVVKLESRPQKLQKTGAFERRAVNRYGAEAFQIKNVLPGSRKHQQPKLASPIKNSRVCTKKNVSRTRLIDMATRILEPGRVRCSLTYPGSMRCSFNDESGDEHFNEHACNASKAKPLTSQASCKNCGESLDVMNLRLYQDEQCVFSSSAPNFVNASCMEQEKDAVLVNDLDASWAVENLQDTAGTYREGKLSSKVGQERRSSPKTRVAASRDKIDELQTRRVSMTVNAVSAPKDFVSLNMNLSGRTRRKSCGIVDDSLPKLRTRKRRPVNVNGHSQSAGFERSKSENERNLQSDAFTRRELRTANSRQRKLILDGNNGEAHFQEPCQLRVDALSALLEQKLKELTSREEDELRTGISHPKKSTTMILRELIAALNAEQPVSHDFIVSATNTPLQAKALNGGTFNALHDGDHFSPGSVLEASFSIDSCFSSSFDESSVPITIPPDSMDFSHSESQPSWKGRKACTDMLSDLANHVAQVLQTMNLSSLTETQITRAREVIFNIELENRTTDFRVGPFLLDELEMFIHSTQPHYIRSLSLEKAKHGMLRGFLFDSMIECLDSSYGRNGNIGFKTWSECAIIQQIDKDIMRWAEMAGKAPDEIVEWEMRHGLGKWIEFDAQVFASGEEIDRYILENLVEEIVIDLHIQSRGLFL